MVLALAGDSTITRFFLIFEAAFFFAGFFTAVVFLTVVDLVATFFTAAVFVGAALAAVLVAVFFVVVFLGVAFFTGVLVTAFSSDVVATIYGANFLLKYCQPIITAFFTIVKKKRKLMFFL